MILNLSKIKTEALLLFCKDLIESYIDKDEHLFNIDEELTQAMDKISKDILKQIDLATLPSRYYIKNRNHYRIRAVLTAYNYINQEITNELKDDNTFNPSMLYFSLLAVWFKELDKESKSKEYIYFIIYPYANVYDKLLIDIKDEKFKLLNIKMLELAERVILKLDKLSLKS